VAVDPDGFGAAAGVEPATGWGVILTLPKPSRLHVSVFKRPLWKSCQAPFSKIFSNSLILKSKKLHAFCTIIRAICHTHNKHGKTGPNSDWIRAFSYVWRREKQKNPGIGNQSPVNSYK
jgi:hypothetical protein